jgi:hypothetical protein
MKVAAENTNLDGVIKISEKEEKSTKKDHVEPVPSSDDVNSKFSDLSESSTDPHDEENGGGVGKSSSNRRQVRSTRSEDYENFEKMLRNKHSKACKAMSVRSLRCNRPLCSCLKEFSSHHCTFYRVTHRPVRIEKP